MLLFHTLPLIFFLPHLWESTTAQAEQVLRHHLVILCLCVRMRSLISIGGTAVLILPSLMMIIRYVGQGASMQRPREYIISGVTQMMV